MVVGLLSLELFLPSAQSLKDKRMILRSVKDRLRRSNVAVAEIAHQQLWQRAGLAVVTVALDESQARRELDAVRDDVDRVAPGLVTDSQIEFLT